jgi:hypothetical protein
MPSLLLVLQLAPPRGLLYPLLVWLRLQPSVKL